MNTNSVKAKKYIELLKDVKKDYENFPEKHENSTFKLELSEHCHEINFYTYWQGLGYADKTPEIKVLLFGQDFGGFDGSGNVININK